MNPDFMVTMRRQREYLTMIGTMLATSTLQGKEQPWADQVQGAAAGRPAVMARDDRQAGIVRVAVAGLAQVLRADSALEALAEDSLVGAAVSVLPVSMEPEWEAPVLADHLVAVDRTAICWAEFWADLSGVP